MGSTNATFDTEFIDENVCGSQPPEWHDSCFGVKLAVPDWEAILTAIVLSVIIVLTIIGNVLVILSVFTYKPLRIVQNFFIVSLAVADLTVALLVLPLNVAYSLLGQWKFGIYLCKIWLTCDVLCCTSSILNLCAIALDRYWAITDPINYAQKRTLGRVILLITGVWLLSLLISSPPLLGWNDWPEEFTSVTLCQLNSDPGYVIYSSLGSFFIPLVIMAVVYIEVFVATRRRLRERAEATKNNTIATRTVNVTLHKSNMLSKDTSSGHITNMCYQALCCCRDSTTFQSNTMVHNDQGSEGSETNVNKEDTDDSNGLANLEVEIVVAPQKKIRRLKVKDSIKCIKSKAIKSEQIKQLNGPQYQMDDSEDIFLQSSVAQRVDLERDEVMRGTTSSQTATTLQRKHTGVHQFIEEKQKISLSKERRAARTLGIIMGAFVICWLPFFLMYIILPFCRTCCPTTKFKNFITWLGYINSILNPIIYTIFNLDYRRAFKRLLGLN